VLSLNRAAYRSPRNQSSDRSELVCDLCGLQPERNRVGFEMAEAYPGENDFLLVCGFHANGPKVPIRLLLRQGDGVIGERLIGTMTRKRGGGTSSNEPVPWDGASFLSNIHAAIISHA
jgi:hypothetical protein